MDIMTRFFNMHMTPRGHHNTITRFSTINMTPHGYHG